MNEKQIRGPSDQSACPAAGCQTDADQETRKVICFCGTEYTVGDEYKSHLEQAHGVSQSRGRPADVSVLGELETWLNHEIASCEWMLKYRNSPKKWTEEEAIDMVRLTMLEIRAILTKAQNQFSESGQGPAR